MPEQWYQKNALTTPIGIVEGTGSLIGNSVIGAFSSLSSFSGTMSNNIRGISMDDDFIDEHFDEEEKQGEPGEFASGFGRGMKKLVKGIGSGLYGVVKHPHRERKKHGVIGIAYGLGKGVAGLVTKPVAGTLDLVTETGKGIKNTPSYLS